MASTRRNRADDSKSRTAILDAAAELMLEEGYGSVTSRRVAGRAGLNAGLVYYYFGTMDDLLVALFRRGAERMLERQAEALSSEQPLWALWEIMHDRANSPVSLEFLALANHRKAVKAEVGKYSKKSRRMLLDALPDILEGYGLDPEEWPPASVIHFLFGMSRFLVMEEAYDLDFGHAGTIAIIERFLREFEGERIREDRPSPARRQR